MQNCSKCIVSSTRRHGNRGVTVVVHLSFHDDVIKWKHFPRYWLFVRGIHRSPVNSPHKGQWREALIFSLICVWLNGWVNNREAGDLRRHRAHYDVTVMWSDSQATWAKEQSFHIFIHFLTNHILWLINLSLLLYHHSTGVESIIQLKSQWGTTVNIYYNQLLFPCKIVKMELLQSCDKPSIWFFCFSRSM